MAMLRRYLGLKSLLGVLAIALILAIGLESEKSITRRLWDTITHHQLVPEGHVSDLLDADLLVRTPGKDLMDQLDTGTGPYTMKLLSIPLSGNSFQVAVQCNDNIIGTFACPPTYYLHFRGPIAYTVPPRYETYQHDASKGETIITCTLRHPGIYELWAYPEWPVPEKCPSEFNNWNPGKPPVPAIAGSGSMIVTILRHTPPPLHRTRPCIALDYDTPMESDWFSLAHILPEYRNTSWLKSHYDRSNSLMPYGELPDYVYLPYQCKRPALNFTALAEENTSLRHILYLGDSIQRSHFCGHLWPAFHQRSEDEDHSCDYSDDIHGYHYASRSFAWSRTVTEKNTSRASTSVGNDSISTLIFSQRFVANDLGVALRHLEEIAKHPTPVTHVVANIGMWFGRPSPESYAGSVRDFLHMIVGNLGPHVHITWLHTATSVPGINCWEQMKRERLRHHSSYANVVIDQIRDIYPTLSIRAIDTFQILDSRPETASDGRHFVREGPLPDIRRRPMVGRGDDAVHEVMWSAWLADYRQISQI